MSQEKRQKAKAIIIPVLLLSICLLQIIMVSAADTATYDEILKPVQAIYDLVKYAVTIIAGLVLLFAGITYILSGADAGKREKAKNMIMYVLIGLALIWAAPFIVKLVLGT
ncbi:MAG: pilin [Candidatus Pacearchaeota archaeon]